MARMEIKRVHTTVHLDPDVLHILNEMEQTTGNNRSQLINDAVRGEYSWRPRVKEMFQAAFTVHRGTVMGEVREAYHVHCEEMKGMLVAGRAELIKMMADELENRHAAQNKLIQKTGMRAVSILKNKKRCADGSNQY